MVYIHLKKKTFQILFFVFTFYVTFSNSLTSPNYFTRDEAKHAGFSFIPRSIVAHFNKSIFRSSRDLVENNFLKHHKIIEKYCVERLTTRGKKCSWRDYYDILDEIREPFNHLFDPGAREITSIKEIYQKILPKRLNRTRSGVCDRIRKPTAKEFQQLMAASHPVIIEGVASKWPALQKWSLDYLRTVWGEYNVNTYFWISNLNICSSFKFYLFFISHHIFRRLL